MHKDDSKHSAIALCLTVPTALTLALLVIFLLPAQMAYAADVTIDVDTTADVNALSTCSAAADDCSLRGAITKANGDAANRYTISIPPSTYVLTATGGGEDANVTGDLDILRSMTLTGTGASSDLTVIDAARIDRVLEVRSGAHATMTNLSVTGGQITDLGGGIYNNVGKLTLTAARLFSNTVTAVNGRGGGLFNLVGQMTLSSVQVFSNTAGGTGGGIYNLDGHATLVAVQVLSNTATDALSKGGGIFNSNAGVITMTNASLMQQNSAGTGGGIHNSGFVSITGSSLIANTATGTTGGGGIYNLGQTALVASQVLSNSATGGDGGGIYSAGGQVTLSNVRLALNAAPSGGSFHGRGGGIYNGPSTLSATDATLIEQNTASNNGGGIYNRGQATLSDAKVLTNTTLTNGGGIYNDFATAGLTVTAASLIQHNRATSNGGGIYNDSATTTLSASQVISNSANFGGGIYNVGGPATLSAVQVDSNSATTSGGGIFNLGAVTATTASLIQNNRAANGGGLLNLGQATLSAIQVLSNTAGTGGGIYNSNGDLALTEVQVLANTANSSGGGGILNSSGRVKLTAVQVLSNTSTATGGGIYNAGASAALSVTSGSLIQNNSATTDGGGIRNYSGQVMLSAAQVVSNRAGWSGGGLYTYGGRLTMSNTAVVSNTAQAVRGGGVYLREGATGDIENSTISGNASAQGNGGGIYVGGPPPPPASNTLTLTHVTVVDNYAAGEGGGLDYNRDHAGDILILRNTILAGNRAGGSHQDCYDNGSPLNYTFNSDANNLFSGAAGDDCPVGASDLSLATLGLTITGVLDTNVADNGGDTLTQALLLGGPAIDAASTAFCTPTDQRGQSRPGSFSTFCDIGAFEAQDVQPDVAITKSAQPTPATPGETVTYTLHFSNTGTGKAAGVLIADSIPLSVSVSGVNSSTVGAGVMITQTGAAPNLVWTTSDLFPAQGGAITVTGLLSDALALLGTTVTNSASITATGDITLPNNSAAAAIQMVQPAAIVVTKTVVGPAPAEDWTFIGPTGTFTLPASGGVKTLTPLLAGSYTISETVNAAYTPSVSCSTGQTGASSVMVTAAAGQTVGCTFTNTRQETRIFLPLIQR